jgi:ATP-dependent DNA helicase RecQ
VVSPLIALMKDQIDFLQARGHPRREARLSLDANQTRAVTDALRAGTIKLLYVAPGEVQQRAVPVMLRARRSRCWPWTRRTASPNGATTSGPTTETSRIARDLEIPLPARADRDGDAYGCQEHLRGVRDS